MSAQRGVTVSLISARGEKNLERRGESLERLTTHPNRVKGRNAKFTKKGLQTRGKSDWQTLSKKKEATGRTFFRKELIDHPLLKESTEKSKEKKAPGRHQPHFLWGRKLPLSIAEVDIQGDSSEKKKNKGKKRERSPWRMRGGEKT